MSKTLGSTSLKNTWDKNVAKFIHSSTIDYIQKWFLEGWSPHNFLNCFPIFMKFLVEFRLIVIQGETSVAFCSYFLLSFLNTSHYLQIRSSVLFPSQRQPFIVWCVYVDIYFWSIIIYYIGNQPLWRYPIILLYI